MKDTPIEKTEDYINGLEGITLLRLVVQWANSRAEFLNEGKTPTQLINEYKKQILK